MTERQSVIAYLQTQKVREPDGEAEEHMNWVLEEIIVSIERGAHRIVEQKRTRR